MILTKESTISFNPQYMTVDDAPWFPVMGEIHYSRVPRHRWERELLKMKAGGVEVVSAYTIWIHHEEIESEWDFEGNKDLHAFMETVKRCGLYCILRIGPWAHGEVRNGGFPDWLVEKEKSGQLQLRSNDPGYLSCAKLFYEKIFDQVKGLFLKENGPIIGIQIENEYGHCGGLQGEEGEEHMRTLQTMAREIGFDAPIYTATGWGGAVTGGMLPVMGGYCEAPWDQRLTEIEPSGNYIFTKERNDHNIGSDHGLGVGITFDMEKFPYLTAELGGGLQVTKHRRPVASAKDIASMSMVKVGSGCNLLGYYMYHGGTNPEGKKTTLQESRATGYPNDLPVLSYDFNAPLREYGQITDTYREIRRLTMFTRDYQDRLCRAVYVPQPGNPEKPEDLSSLRTAVRIYTEKAEDGTEFSSGFYFVNNYQRRYSMADHTAVTPTAYDAAGNPLAIYDVMDIKDGDFFLRPFNLKIGDAVLKTTNAIPLCILNGESDDEKVYVFYVRDGQVPDYRIKGNLGKSCILTLSDEEALHASKAVIDGKEYLFVSEGDVVLNTEGIPELLLSVTEEKKPSFRVWPELPESPKGFHQTGNAGKMYRTVGSGIFAEYVSDDILKNPMQVKTAVSPEGEKTKVSITVEGFEKFGKAADTTVDQVMLALAYEGESAELFRNGKLSADNFYTGQVWEIGISDLLEEKDGTVDAVIAPLTEEDKEKIYLQNWPKLEDGRACRLNEAKTYVTYRIKMG